MSISLSCLRDLLLASENIDRQPINFMRYWGFSALTFGVCFPIEQSSVGASVLIRGIECGSVEVPLHKAFLNSDLGSGPLVVG